MHSERTLLEALHRGPADHAARLADALEEIDQPTNRGWDLGFRVALVPAGG